MRSIVPYASMGIAVVLLVASGSTITPGALSIVLLGGAIGLIAIAAASWASQGNTASRTIAKCGVTGAVISGVLFGLLLGGPWSSGGHGEVRVTVLSQPAPVFLGVLAGALLTALLCALIGALGYGFSRVILRERKELAR